MEAGCTLVCLIDLCREVNNLVHFSPKRLHLFSRNLISSGSGGSLAFEHNQVDSSHCSHWYNPKGLHHPDGNFGRSPFNNPWWVIILNSPKRFRLRLAHTLYSTTEQVCIFAPSKKGCSYAKSTLCSGECSWRYYVLRRSSLFSMRLMYRLLISFGNIH